MNFHSSSTPENKETRSSACWETATTTSRERGFSSETSRPFGVFILSSWSISYEWVQFILFVRFNGLCIIVRAEALLMFVHHTKVALWLSKLPLGGVSWLGSRKDRLLTFVDLKMIVFCVNEPIHISPNPSLYVVRGARDQGTQQMFLISHTILHTEEK